jgi:hypothetical protein
MPLRLHPLTLANGCARHWVQHVATLAPVILTQSLRASVDLEGLVKSAGIFPQQRADVRRVLLRGAVNVAVRLPAGTDRAERAQDPSGSMLRR